MKNRSKDGRRRFIKKSSAAAFGSVLFNTFSQNTYSHAFEKKVIKIGLVGCGGRGTGALFEALKASASVRVVAIADVFEDRTKSVFALLKQNFGDQCEVNDTSIFVGFDAYEKVIALSDAVILATPPPFRPQHFESSIKAGKHVFMEKPSAVEVPGSNRIMETESADEKKKA